VGLELQARIGKLINPVHYQRGWHGTSTVGTIGTAGACTRLLGLDQSGVLAAMSIAFSMVAGSKKQFGSMMKPIHAGLAAQHGLMAARMAAVGISGTPDFLTGSWSFQELYADRDDSLIESSLLGLGERLAILDDGLLVKRFPCCASAHCLIESK